MEKEQSGIYMMEARVSPHRSDFRLFKTSIFFPAKSETKPPYLIIRPGVLLCPFTAPRSGNLTVLNFTHVKFRDHELNSVFLLTIFSLEGVEGSNRQRWVKTSCQVFMSPITGNSTIDYVTHSAVPCSLRRCINLPRRVGDTRHPGFPCRQMDDRDQPVGGQPPRTRTHRKFVDASLQPRQWRKRRDCSILIFSSINHKSDNVWHLTSNKYCENEDLSLFWSLTQRFFWTVGLFNHLLSLQCTHFQKNCFPLICKMYIRFCIHFLWPFWCF